MIEALMIAKKDGIYEIQEPFCQRPCENELQRACISALKRAERSNEHETDDDIPLSELRKKMRRERSAGVSCQHGEIQSDDCIHRDSHSDDCIHGESQSDDCIPLAKLLMKWRGVVPSPPQPKNNNYGDESNSLRNRNATRRIENVNNLGGKHSSNSDYYESDGCIPLTALKDNSTRNGFII